ncbi:extended synaptotagmin-like protein 2 isoform X2 [Rhodnius prolixus]|uniref:extended synaptotagmin-like protein 2 isoform X2 n=1 Tax=Rhodnius prolixus TaxID=13249 RepID=UPI003D1879D6
MELETIEKKEPTEDTDDSKVIAKRIGTGSNILHLLYNFSKQLGKVAVVYLLGYFNISPAWLIGPVILSVLREEWGKEKELKRNIAKAAALSNEKDVILARVDDLPAWVFFPDIERAEWVNKILSQVWPNVNHYAKDLVKDVIEPAVQDSLLQYKLTGFSFQKMRLGTIPPRVGGVKVYDKNVSRNEIIMDMDIFYAGDCDISFTLGGLSGGIKDFQIHGMVRVVMKPLIRTIPLVGGLQIYFLNNPTLDFNLVGVADLLDMPGLSDMLRKIIVEQVSAMMVLPNKLPILLSDAVPAQVLKFPEPQGVLRVHVVEAKQLMKKDINVLGKGKSDPYAIITLGAETFRTKTIDNTIEPKWDYWCEAIVTSRRIQELRLTVWDWDPKFPGVQNDDYLGRATVEVHGVTQKGQVDTWISLEEAKTGMVHLRMTWLQLSDKLADLKEAMAETQLLRVTSMSSCVLMVFVDSVKNLPKAGGKSGGAQPDPMFQISVAKTTHQSNIQYRTDSPVYEQGFTFLVNNPEVDTLHLKFTDQKTGTELGKLAYNLSNLLDKENLELQDQPLQVKNAGPETKVIMSMRLRVLKYCGGSAQDVDEISLYGEEITAAPPAQLTREASIKKQDSVSVKSEGSPEHKLFEAMQPVEDPMIATEAPPKVESVPPSTLHHRQPSTTSSLGESSLGKIQLTLRYSVQRQRLIIIVHKIANLPLKDPSNIPDPYVKLYLLPERSKESKRKTETIKDNCNPVYDETFEYIMSQGELSNRQLEVTVLTQKTWKSPVMGQVVVNLAELDLTKALTSWFDLQPEIFKEKEQ